MHAIENVPPVGIFYPCINISNSCIETSYFGLQKLAATIQVEMSDVTLFLAIFLNRETIVVESRKMGSIRGLTLG